MSFEEIRQKLEDISEKLVLSNTSEQQEMLELHTKINDLTFLAKKLELNDIVEISKQSAKQIERLVVDFQDNPDEIINSVSENISKLQLMINNYQNDNNIKDEPVELEEEKQIKNEQTAKDNIQFKHPSRLPENVDIEIFTEFLSRQSSVLDDLEESILEYENEAREDELIKLKRIIHTMKGESGLLGLNEVQKICHTTETLLEDLPPEGLVDILLGVKDWLGRSFSFYAGDGPAPGPADVLMELLLKDISVEIPKVVPTQKEIEKPLEKTEVVNEEVNVERTEFNILDSDINLINDFIIESTEHLDSVEIQMLTLETSPDDDKALNSVFRSFHTIKGVAGYLSLEQIASLSHVVENLLDKLRKGKLQIDSNIIDVIFDSVDMMKKLIGNVKITLQTSEKLKYENNLDSFVEVIERVVSGENIEEVLITKDKDKKIGEILVEKGVTTEDIIDKALVEQKQEADKHLGEILIKEKEVSAKDVAQAIRSQQREPVEGKAIKVRESIKVDADRLDKLIDMIGELVITESMVSQNFKNVEGSAEYMASIGLLDKITKQLQEMSTSLRLVPVKATFQKMARLVRDLSKKSGKKIEFVMTGEDTELDKSVVDKIGDPLVHMIRNSVDHGIEDTTEERVAAGKSKIAKVELKAYHKAGNIFIEVIDDGKGLNFEKIIEKAVANKLIKPDAKLTEKEIGNLIFAPGFSTAKIVTEVSGRGIGMDVVRRNIESLRGNVEIISERNKGSIFQISLPLTLAIIDGMMIGVGEERYIVPTLSIVRSLRPSREMLSTMKEKGEMISVDGQLIPLFHLSRLFGIEVEQKDLESVLVVIVESAGMYTGIIVDDLLGQQQIVIKTLGQYLQGIPGIAGSTILTDGQVALILDVAGLVKIANF